MKKGRSFTFIVTVVLLTTLAVVLSLFPGNQRCKISKVLAASISSESVTQWQIYSDSDYGFSLEYPVGWESVITIFQETPYEDESAIIKRQTFTGAQGWIDLDIWLANGQNLEEWSGWYSKTRAPFPITKSNAKVWGNPAMSFLERGGTVDMLATFFSDGKYVYRLWYTVTQNRVGLQVYHHMLNTIELPGISDRKATPAELPEKIWKSVEAAVQESGLISPLVSSCCGYSQSSNPFPCCNNKGNCTWWVYYKFGAVPFRGDAGTWWSQVPNYSGWLRSSLPRADQANIAWWSGSPGHVAYVSNYTGGSNVTISEMLWCTSCGRTRTISRTTPGGYIYLKNPPRW